MSQESFNIAFIGVGPQKTGSTWLHEVLKNHPDLCLPTLVKEIQFFDAFYSKGMAEYESYFHHCKPGQLKGEITPGYFDEVEVPARIHQHFPKAKIIVSLRHPVKRAESLFRHHLRKGRVSMVYSEAIEQMPRILESGYYKQHLTRWLEFFPAEQVKVVLMEDIARRPEEVLEDLLKYLQVSNADFNSNLGEKVNGAGMPKYPMLAKYAAQIVVKMKNHKLHKLVDVGKSLGLKKVYDGGRELPGLTEKEKYNMLETYSDDVQYVETLLDKKLPSWHEIY